MTNDDRSSKIVFPPQLVRRVEFPTHAMSDVLGQLHDVQPIKSEHNPKKLVCRDWTTREFAIAKNECGAATIERSRQKAEVGSHLLTLQRYSGGRVHGFLGDQNIDRIPGNMYLFDIANRVKCIQFPVTLHCIYISKSAIGYKPGIHPPLMQFPLTSQMGALLEIQLFKIFQQVLEADQFDRIEYDRLIALLKVAIDSEDQDQSTRRLAQNSLKAMIQSHIEANLASPTLSLTSLLKTYGVSRASLFRMFEVYGGVRRYINDRRLYRAVLDISERPMVRGSVSDAAEKWGFSSNANFNRAVKRTFGTAPSSLINSNFLKERAA